MSYLNNKSLVRRYYEEVLNQRQLQVFDDLTDPRFQTKQWPKCARSMTGWSVRKYIIIGSPVIGSCSLRRPSGKRGADVNGEIPSGDGGGAL